MSDLLNWAFGLERLRLGDAGVSLAFERPLPAWAWALAAAGAVALAWWSYSRLVGAGGRLARASLAGLRAATLLLVGVLLSGPQIVRVNEQTEPDWVVVLADRSASMQIKDAPPVGTPDAPGPAAPAGERITRDEQLRRAIGAHAALWGALARERTLVWMGFDAGAFDLAPGSGADGPDAAGMPDLGAPAGRRTQLGASLEQVLRRAAARPLSGVVVLSDGASADTVPRGVLRRLEAEQIPVFVVPLGSASPVLDLALTRVEAPSLAFLHDAVAVRARVERLGGAADGAVAASGRVRLIDAQSGAVLDERSLPPPEEWQADGADVTLRTRPGEAGRVQWRVELLPDVPDLVDANNAAAVGLELVDRPLRVAYFDGYPRWEYRYVKNLMLREGSITSSATMLSANRRYVQEGEQPLDAVPRSPEEWAPFDVVVIGDVRADLFSHEQLEALRQHVAQRGAGLLWIAGPASTPWSWVGTPLGDLLPFRAGAGVPGGGARLAEWDEPVTLARTPLAERLGLLELGDTPDEPWPRRLSDPATGWSRLRYAQRLEREILKPTAETLAVALSADDWAQLSARVPRGDVTPALGDLGVPVVISMRYGAGRVLYVGTDETWRYRYARGEALQERFWLPLLRLQGRESLSRGGQSATLEAAPKRAAVDQPVRFTLRLLDQALVDERPGGVALRIERVGPDAEPWPPVELSLSPDGARDAGATFLTYTGTFLPTVAGTFEARAVDPLLFRLNLSVRFEAALPDDELRRPEADHALLARLAGDSGGVVLAPDDLRALPALLPKRALTLAGAPDIETLWDKPGVLLVLVGLLTAEWIGRRLIKLL